jgi:hypothetical protein
MLRSVERKAEVALAEFDADQRDQGLMCLISWLMESAGIREAIIKLFDDDQDAQIIVEGMMEDMDGEDLRELTDLDKKEFASKRRLVRRRIDKAFPEGWTNG